MTIKTTELITMREFLFLHWLYQRKVSNHLCDLEFTDIQCKNCLNQKERCKQGLIPASYFYKKIQRQYYDCKRVLDKLENHEYIKRIEIEGNGFSVFYQISESGILFYNSYIQLYNI